MWWYKITQKPGNCTMWRFYRFFYTRYNVDTRLMWKRYLAKQLNSSYRSVKNLVYCLTIQSKLCEWRTEVSRDEGGANRADFSLKSKTYRMDNKPQRYQNGNLTLEKAVEGLMSNIDVSWMLLSGSSENYGKNCGYKITIGSRSVIPSKAIYAVCGRGGKKHTLHKVK